MIKTLVYVPDPENVRSLAEIEAWGLDNGKLRKCYVNNGQDAYSLEQGAHVITGKGHELYVVHAENGQHDFCEAKPCNITSIVQVDYPFGNAPGKSSAKQVSSYEDKIVNMYLPKEINDFHVTIDNVMCLEHNGEWIGFDKENNLVSYPEDVTFAIPAWIMSVPVTGLKVGDTILNNNTYSKVTAIKDNVVSSLDYKGSNHNTKTIKDFVIQQSLVKVVITVFDMDRLGTTSNGVNPMMLMMMKKDKNEKSKNIGDLLGCKKENKLKKLLPFMMMQGGKEVNPLMFAALSDGDDSLLPLMLMGQNGGDCKNLLPLMLLGDGNNDTMKLMCMMQMMGNTPKA